MALSVVKTALQWIGPLLIQEAGVLFAVEDQVQGLRQELELMQHYLQDADNKQADSEVHTLICQIRKLVYDAEDVIDTFLFKVHSKVQWHDGDRLMRFAFSIYRAPHIYKLGKQTQVIQTDAKRISDRLSSIGMRRLPLLNQNFKLSWGAKPRSYPFDDDNDEYVVGLEKDISELVEVLVADRNAQINVLSFVGMGGSGKTTLARKLYNHPYVKQTFDCVAWVFISQEWRTQHVLSEILRKVGDPTETSELHARPSLEELVDKIRSVLRGKRYLVVLDDVWRREALQEFLPALPSGDRNRGSKIIITTRKRDITQFQNMQQHLHIHELLPLNEEEGWKLFRKIALRHCTSLHIESFEVLGKEMLTKCDGLPLAIVALAGILSTRQSITSWQQVSETVRSIVFDGVCTQKYGRVGEILALSYDDLPYDLKPCFLHLGVFPEDCPIPTGMLIRMWIAEGLVPAHEGMSLEDVAMQHLEELSHRFMIQVVKTNYMGVIKTVRMHDLLRDLCVRKAKEQSFLQIYNIDDPYRFDTSVLTVQPRRAALHSSNSLPAQISQLRSLVLLTWSGASRYSYNFKMMLDLQIVPHKFKLLRLLNIWGVEASSGALPTDIGSLIHLKYLGIRATNITVLPSSIGNLWKLLTLDYRDVDSENKVQIPNVLWKLVSLRHLFLPVECSWSINNLNLSTLKNLWTLWGVKQEGSGYWLMREIPNLISIRKLKVVVSSERELEAIFSCPSLKCDVLQTIHCELRGSISLSNVELLCHRQHLHKMTLIGQISMKLSLLLPINLVILKLKDSMLQDEDPMSTLGTLGHLKLLSLSNSYVGANLACEPLSFPQLEELTLDSFPNLKMWKIENGAMPCLSKLGITRCSALQEFPRGLEFVKTLQQLEFFAMPAEFIKKAVESGWLKSSRLPRNFSAIIKRSDSNSIDKIDFSSIEKIYEQLFAGIFLNNRTQKYWVKKQNNNYFNCFMVYASDLHLKVHSWFEIERDGKGTFHKMVDDPCVECRESVESTEDSTIVTVAVLKALSDFVVIGTLSTENLSLGVTYEIVWIIMLEISGKKFSDKIYVDGIESTIIETRVNGMKIVAYEENMDHKKRNIRTRRNGMKAVAHEEYRNHKQRVIRTLLNDMNTVAHEKYMDDKSRDEWIRVPGGEFVTDSTVGKDLVPSLSYTEGIARLGVVIKGFIIQPKL